MFQRIIKLGALVGLVFPLCLMAQGKASITGTAYYKGPTPTRKSIDMSIEPVCVAKHEKNSDEYPSKSEALVLGPDNAIQYVFVRITKGPALSGTFTPPSKPVVLDQDGCQYHPHVLGVMANQPLKILNADGVLHNLHFLPKVNKPFNATMPPFLKEKEVSFSKPEPIFHIKCDVHPWMSGWVAVMDNPFYAVTSSDGTYKIDNLEPGTYSIEAWQEVLGTQTSTVTLSGDESKAIDFTFTYSK
jgi:hypothetical protein